MPSIEIIAIPKGQAPPEIQEAWLRLILPLANGGKTCNRCYKVHMTAAVASLVAHGQTEAAQWWIEHNLENYSFIIFDQSVCRLIVDGQEGADQA